MNQYSEENPYRVNPYKGKGYTLAADVIAPLLGLAEVIGTKGQSRGDFSIGLSKNIRQQAADYENQAGTWEEQQQRARQAALERELKSKQQAREDERFGWEKNKQVAEQNYMAELSNAMTLKDPLERAKKNAEIEARYGRRPLEIPKQEEEYPSLPKNQKFSDPMMQALYEQGMAGDKASQKLFYKHWKPKEPKDPKEPNQTGESFQVTPEMIENTSDPMLKEAGKQALLGNKAANDYFLKKYRAPANDPKIKAAKGILNDYITFANMVGPQGRVGGTYESVKGFVGLSPEVKKLNDYNLGIGLVIARMLQGSSQNISNVDAKVGSAFQFKPTSTPEEWAINNMIFENMLDEKSTPEEKRKFMYNTYKNITGKDPYKMIEEEDSKTQGFITGKTYRDANGNTAIYGGQDSTGKDIWK